MKYPNNPPLKDFYNLSSKHWGTTLQAPPVGLRRRRGEQLFENKRKLIEGDYAGLVFPIIFQQRSGKWLRDIIHTGLASLYLISKRFKEILESHCFSGYSTYPIKLYDAYWQRIPDYFGFSITGRCGPIDFTKSEVIYKQFPGGV